MGGTRRRFLKAAATLVGAAATPDAVNAQAPDRAVAHEHQTVPSDLTLRVKSLESLLVEKGLVDRAALDALIDTMEHKVGPRNGARVVARAWVDPAYKKRLLENAPAAIAELGYTSGQGEHMVVVENTPKVHNLVVCTLCSCYPWPVLGLPPVWYKSAPYRSRAVIDPRGILERVRNAAGGRRRGARLGQHRGAALHRAARASRRHRTDDRRGTGRARHARCDGRRREGHAPSGQEAAMNGVHDMGGQHGMGPVQYEKDEPVFHARLGRPRLRAHPRDARLAQVEHRHRPARDRAPAAGRLSANELLRALVEQARNARREVRPGHARRSWRAERPAAGSTQSHSRLDAGDVCRAG